MENGLSTGQKQLVDLKETFKDDNGKQILIFDEADNALDRKNKNEFQEKVSQASEKKLVISISH